MALLEPTVDGILRITIPQTSTWSSNQINLDLNDSPQLLLPQPVRDTRYQPCSRDLELLNRFQTRTILTIGSSKAAPIYQYELFRLGCSVSIRIPRLAGRSDSAISARRFTPRNVDPDNLARPLPLRRTKCRAFYRRSLPLASRDHAAQS